MFSSMCIVSVNYFTNGSLDRNGKQPIILNVVSGKFPNRTVLSGTIAESNGFEVGKTYLASVKETESNEFGRQFIWQKLKEVDAMEIVTTSTHLGNAEMFDASAKEVSVTKKETTAPFSEED